MTEALGQDPDPTGKQAAEQAPGAARERRADSLVSRRDVEGGLIYALGRLLSGGWVRVANRLKVEGLENLPRERPYLVAANHQSFWDIPVIAWTVPGHVGFLARSSLQQSRFMEWLLRHAGAIIVERGTSDRVAIRKMVAHLEGGDVVGVFPEGTRGRNGRLGDFKRGVLLAARQTGLPVVPAGIRGSYHAFGRDHKLPGFTRIAVRYGKPLDGRDPELLAKLKSSIQEMIGEGRFDSVPPV